MSFIRLWSLPCFTSWEMSLSVKNYLNVPSQCIFFCWNILLFPELDMADLMWGGVPFTIPSVTAMKYISGAVQVKVTLWWNIKRKHKLFKFQREKNLPIGGHYNARQTMEREVRTEQLSDSDFWKYIKIEVNKNFWNLKFSISETISKTVCPP